MTVQIFVQSRKSPLFRLRGKVGQLGRRKTVLYWSIHIISLCLIDTKHCPKNYRNDSTRIKTEPGADATAHTVHVYITRTISAKSIQ